MAPNDDPNPSHGTQKQVGVLGVLGVLLIVSLVHRGGDGSGGSGGRATPRAHNPADVPQALRPIPAYKDKECKDVHKLPTLAGQRYIQIHNQVGLMGGWVQPCHLMCRINRLLTNPIAKIAQINCSARAR